LQLLAKSPTVGRMMWVHLSSKFGEKEAPSDRRAGMRSSRWALVIPD
jgi:hypothetical protein